MRNVEGRATEIMKVSALLVPALGAFLLFFEGQTVRPYQWVILALALVSVGTSIWCALHCMRHFPVSGYMVPDQGEPPLKTDREWALLFKPTLLRGEKSVERCRTSQKWAILFIMSFILSMGLDPILRSALSDPAAPQSSDAPEQAVPDAAG